MLIGKINDRNRQKLLITIRSIKGTKMIDFRLHHTSEDGEFVATAAGVSLTLDQAEQAVGFLQEAQRVIRKDQGE